MSSLFLPNPCLLGILLCISTHDGNHLVFHYPPKPGYFGYRPVPLRNSSIDQAKAYSDSSSESSSTEEEEEEEDEAEWDDEFGKGGQRSGRNKSEDKESDEDSSSSTEANATADYEGNEEAFSERSIMDDERRSEPKNDTADDALRGRRSRGSQMGLNTRPISKSNRNYSISSVEEARRDPASPRIRTPMMSASVVSGSNINGNEAASAGLTRSVLSNYTAAQPNVGAMANSMASLTSSIQRSGSGGSSGWKRRHLRRRKRIHKVKKLFGFDLDFLADIVCPPKALCNNRFELTVEDTAFLGLPIHIGEDGNWRPTHHHHRHHHGGQKGEAGRSRSKRSRSSLGSQAEGLDSEESGLDEKNEDANREDLEAGVSEDGRRSKDADQGGQDEDEDDCPMYLFNLVFVMNPPVDEYNYRTDEMYYYVISRLTLLLRYEQQKSNYVWKESSDITRLKEEAMSLGLSVKKQWNYIVEKSSLARVIKQTYMAMKNSEIVNVEINGKFNSFQIPITTEFSAIPPAHTRLLPGSTLSSISPFNGMMMDPVSNPGFHPPKDELTVYFALLLLDDPESIVQDIKAKKDSLIANFIRMIKPSESLIKLSALSGLTLNDVKLFASHLVYWRRAKAILPLTPRNIYVVSPIAPMDDVYSDSVKFRQAFPNLPPLTDILSLISTNSDRPHPINSIIPSRDHRDLYMRAISWLAKRGYLTQLYTFLWVKITKQIKIKVDEEVEIERKRRESMKKKKDFNILASPKNARKLKHMPSGKRRSHRSLNRGDLSEEGTGLSLDEFSADEDRSESVGQKLPKHGVEQDDENPEGVGRSDTNDQAIIDSEDEEDERVNRQGAKSGGSLTGSTKYREFRRDSGLREKALNTDNTTKKSAGARRPDMGEKPWLNRSQSTGSGSREMDSMSSTFGTSRSSLAGAPIQFEEEEEEDTILTDPESATALERRWIAKCVESKPLETVNLFYKLLKFMNGQNPLELVILKENVSRQDVRKMLSLMHEHVVVSRHW